MFDESAETARAKWAQSIAKRGFHYERGMQIGAFIFYQPIHAVIVSPRLSENSTPTWLRILIWSSFWKPQLPVCTYQSTHNQLPHLWGTLVPALVIGLICSVPMPCSMPKFKVWLFANAMCTNPMPMGGFLRKEFIPRKLKPEYELTNKIVYNMIVPKGKEKLPSEEEIQFLFEVMNGGLIDYGMVIWCIMRDFIKSTSEKELHSISSTSYQIRKSCWDKGLE